MISQNQASEEAIDLDGAEAPGYSAHGNDIDVKVATGTGGKPTGEFTDSKTYEEWYERLACGDPNDMVFVITADPRYTGVTGTGKSTLGGGLAKWYFDISDRGWDPEINYTMTSGDIEKMYSESQTGSCLVYDEAQGTPSDTGLNSKRSMKEDALGAINTVATGRKQRKSLIVIAQSLKSLNKDLFDYVDAWILIQDDTNYKATRYDLYPEVFDLGSNEIKTPGIEELKWDPLPPDSEDYAVMERIKDEASDVSGGEDGESWSKREMIIRSQALRDAGYTLREVASDPYIDYKYSWVNEHTSSDPPAERDGPGGDDIEA
jgi:hypothetical protein